VVAKILDNHNHEIHKEIVDSLPKHHKLDSAEENTVQYNVGYACQ